MWFIGWVGCARWGEGSGLEISIIGLGEGHFWMKMHSDSSNLAMAYPWFIANRDWLWVSTSFLYY